MKQFLWRLAAFALAAAVLFAGVLGLSAVKPFSGILAKLTASTGYDASVAEEMGAHIDSVRTPDGADALILWGMGSEMALLASQSRELGLDVQLAGGGAMDNTVAYVEAAGEASDGTIFATWMIPEETQERYDAFTADFEAAYNAAPESESILTYDAVYIIAEGLKAAGGDKTKLNDALKDLTYTGLYGTYSFTESGDNTIPVSIVQWEGTDRVLLEQIDPTPFY